MRERRGKWESTLIPFRIICELICYDLFIDSVFAPLVFEFIWCRLSAIGLPGDVAHPHPHTYTATLTPINIHTYEVSRGLALFTLCEPSI